MVAENGLSVCIITFTLLSDRDVTVVTVPGTARGTGFRPVHICDNTSTMIQWNLSYTYPMEQALVHITEKSVK